MARWRVNQWKTRSFEVKWAILAGEAVLAVVKQKIPACVKS